MSFAIYSKLRPSLVELPKGVNECSMTFVYTYMDPCCATVVSVYAPTLDSDDDVIAQFHLSLRGSTEFSDVG